MTFRLTAQARMTQGQLEITCFIVIVKLVVYDVILKVAYDFLYKSSYTMTLNTTKAIAVCIEIQYHRYSK